MRSLGLLFLLFISVTGTAQYHVFKLNTSFILDSRPLSGAAFERAQDSSLFTFGISTEFGSFEERSSGPANAPIVRYSLTGIGLQPEVRRYAGFGGRPAPLGFFVAAYVRTRHLWMLEQSFPGSGTSASDETGGHLSRGLSFDYGFGLGYKTGHRNTGAHVECSAGYCISHSRLFYADHGVAQFVRFDIFICGIFQRRSTTSLTDEW